MKSSSQKIARPKKRARLLIGESERGAEMLYATGFRAPDEFLYVEYQKRRTILLSDLEIDRGRRDAKVEEVLSWTALKEEVTRLLQRTPTEAETIAAFVKKKGATHLVVPATFPLGLARALEKLELILETQEGPFFPERLVKQPHELQALTRATEITEAGMACAHEILKACRIQKNRELFWKKQPLTSERLRQEVESTMYRAGGIPAGDSIIAGGLQACDPHERGHGLLRAHELIILDLFPRAAQSGYYGDLTRTVVRGRASEAQRHLWETCLAGQELAFQKIKAGASGKKIHDAVQVFFASTGYPKEQKEGRWSGFFHGLGHGLGLELHEEPRFGTALLKPNNVFTIEPGLYIPGLGGVRHEDVIVVTSKGYQLLSHFPKMLEI